MQDKTEMKLKLQKRQIAIAAAVAAVIAAGIAIGLIAAGAGKSDGQPQTSSGTSAPTQTVSAAVTAPESTTDTTIETEVPTTEKPETVTEIAPIEEIPLTTPVPEPLPETEQEIALPPEPDPVPQPDPEPEPEPVQNADNGDWKTEQARAVAESLAAGITGETDLDRVAAAAAIVADYSSRASYTMSGEDYATAYGVFVKGEYSCAGSTRALGMLLECMGYSWRHVNENLYTHQWVEITMDGQRGWADGQIGMAGYGDFPFAVEVTDEN